ncbi:allophanate hydrolase [Hoyosella sp. G463]|uniref:Allophanate hydrolase n=1 Tax=Lolliginicoccus lacisalsi TaxID=2742202 RepID=A0A927PL59_9ACTN|nr:allophanate hydrolase [Lolliginicoccus lacisalsi]MBD8505057.1 allophanate hydrolase [Lolliginicoccus lacisalsi]
MNTAQDRARQAYARIDETDRPEAWIHLRPLDDVLADARRLDARVTDGEHLPLAGTAFAVKDNIDIAGLPTTAACPGFAYVPERTATAAQRLIDAGSLVLGKTNLDQFATGLVGTRSPYGVCRNAHDAERISGGSSSGSAVVVALGIADFALGTDTAGSGRVPAALNGIVGIKATLGLVPVDGVVPACPSYDCVTVFAHGLPDAVRAMRVITGPSDHDPASRTWPATAPLAAPPEPVIAVPSASNLAALSPAARDLFDQAAGRLEDHGARLKELDIAPFLEAARLLYDGALVAERYASFGAGLEEVSEDPASAASGGAASGGAASGGGVSGGGVSGGGVSRGGVDPTVRAITMKAKDIPARDLVRDQQHLRALRLRARSLLDGFDAMLVPTAPEHPTIEDVQADPIGVNSRMGTYTNFMNLLDMAGIAVPAGEADGGRFGVTIVTRAFEDQVGIDIAALLTGTEPPLYPSTGLDVALFGAHMRGLALNHQMITHGGRFIREIATSPRYTMQALPTDIPKPAVTRTGTASLVGELWQLPPAGLGAFLDALPQPMTLGKIELADGTWVTGFGCSDPTGEDISAHGGWRAYLDLKPRS